MASESSAGVSRGFAGDESEYFLANKMGRIFHLALEEVVGGQALRAVLSSARLQDRLDVHPPNDFNLEFPFDELGRVQRALEELYGPGRARELGTQVGRVGFKMGAEDLNPVLGLTDLVLRVLPLRLRLKIGLEVLAHISTRFSDQEVRLEENGRSFAWIVERCSACWGRRSNSPCCHILVGLVEEGVYWLSGGQSLRVEETSCTAAGDSTCTILVQKRLPEDSSRREEEV